jgi:hypothetical protein
LRNRPDGNRASAAGIVPPRIIAQGRDGFQSQDRMRRREFIAGWPCSVRHLRHGGSGTVPLFSLLLVAALLILSVVLFSRLIQRLNDLRITNVLHIIGDKGLRSIGSVGRGA